jgi:hypothetical protein
MGRRSLEKVTGKNTGVIKHGNKVIIYNEFFYRPGSIAVLTR